MTVLEYGRVPYTDILYRSDQRMLNCKDRYQTWLNNCQTALVKLINDWIKCTDKADLVGALFIDFRKAFDLVDHSILLNKFALYKLNPSAIQWFKSYLCSRQQVIESDKRLTDFTTVQSGVPQGSILGPTLFSFLSTIFRFISKSAPLICMQMTRRFTRMVMT